MKKTWLVIAAVILLVGGGAFYAVYTQKKGKHGGTMVRSVQAQIGSIEDTVQATGEVMPLNRVEIKPPIPGRIEQLLVNEGDRVKAGEILGWMSSTDRAAILDAARAKGPEEMKHWQDAYKPTPIIAPLSGTMILRNVVVGQTVDGTTVLYAMSDKLIVKADVDETDIGRIRLGMPAVVTLDSYPDKPIQGKVFQILYEGVNTSNVITYGVKIAPGSVPPFFRSQMTANISLVSSRKDNIVLLPVAAVTANANGDKQVMVPDEKGKPVAQPVETGMESEENIEITSGIKEGQTVLVVSKRYKPQQNASNSPLVMGGAKQGQGSGSGKSGRGPH
jgi:membrane fusion protein, macrolide-specific efflux system